MQNDISEWYRDILISAIGKLDSESSLPVPWFTRNIWHRLQWTSYIGECQKQDGSLVFGLNLEFTDTWRKIRPRLSTPLFKDMLARTDNAEWHWYGRPGYICRNPYMLHLSEPIPVSDLDVDNWLIELDDILDHRRNWDNGRYMRPQIQIMRVVGKASFDESADNVKKNIRRMISDTTPLIDLLVGRK